MEIDLKTLLTIQDAIHCTGAYSVACQFYEYEPYGEDEQIQARFTFSLHGVECSYRPWTRELMASVAFLSHDGSEIETERVQQFCQEMNAPDGIIRVPSNSREDIQEAVYQLNDAIRVMQGLAKVGEA